MEVAGPLGTPLGLAQRSLALGLSAGMAAQVCPERVTGWRWLGATLESARKAGDGGLHPDLEPVQVLSCPL